MARKDRDLLKAKTGLNRTPDIIANAIANPLVVRDFYKGSELGDNCHFKNGAIPVAVITDLKGTIISGNAIVSAEGIVQNPSDTPGWLVSGCKIMVTRFWAASTASIALTCSFKQGQVPPQVPEVLSYERDFCVWIGFINEVRAVVQSDLKNGLLVRTFVGVIENQQVTCSATGGVTLQIQARCRMKWLMDSMVYLSPDELKKTAENEDKASSFLRRSDLILKIAQRGIGQGDETECIDCGKQILKSKEYTIDIEDDALINSDTWYESKGPLVGKTRTDLEVQENPEFRIFVGRAGIQLEQASAFLVNQQLSIEIIKFLALQEVFPTEVFQDSRDGNFYFCPRANDITGLVDPKRFFRTYYWGGAPEDSNVNQSTHSFREERSSISLKTNFLIDKSAPLSDNSGQDDWMIHLRTKPDALKNVRFACKIQRISDPTIQSLAEAATVALAMARIMGRETRAAMIVVSGDPSLIPGEVIQIIGSPMLKNGGRDQVNSDRSMFLEYNERYKDNVKEYGEQAFNGVDEKEIELPVYDKSVAKFSVSPEAQDPSEIMCKTTSQVQGENGIGFNKEPETIFRIDAVMHKINMGGSTGYTSECALLSPF